MKESVNNIDTTPFPKIVVADITNFCNYDCIFCPQAILKNVSFYSPINMPFPIFKKITDEVSRYPNTIFNISSFGEPLMHPNFIEMLQYANSKSEDMKIKFNTNGSLLAEELIKDLIKIGVHEIEISINAHTLETYKKLHPRSSLELVKKNILEFKRLSQVSRKKTIISVTFIRNLTNFKEIKEFKSFWSGIADNVVIRHFSNWMGNISDTLRDPQDWKNIKFCPIPFNLITINGHGDFKYCCKDIAGFIGFESIMGNIENNTIHQIWNSKQANFVRDKILRQEYDSLPLCKRCYDYDLSINNHQLPGRNYF